MRPSIRIFLVSILYLLGAATMANSQQQAPIGPWEKLSHGVAVIVALRGDVLTASIKNTSSEPRNIFGDDRQPVLFFYVTSNGERAQLVDKVYISYNAKLYE